MNKKKGLILIIVAILLFIGYMIFTKLSLRPTTTPKAEPTDKIVSSSNISTATMPADGVDETVYNIKINVNPQILKLMKVSKREFAKEIRIYANSSGNAAAELIDDMDEVNINYGVHKITVPCYFKVGKYKNKFDIIYYYQAKEWQFVPF